MTTIFPLRERFNKESHGTWRGDLKWYFGAGMVAVLPRALSVHDEETRPQTVDGWDVVRFGFIDRVLRSIEPITPVFPAALALAYGDEGEAWTCDGKWAHWRWKAVACLTRQARKHGEAWAKEQKPREVAARDRRDPNTHTPALRWCDHFLNQSKRSPAEDEVFAVLQAQSSNLLAAAEAAFAEAHTRMTRAEGGFYDDEAEIRRLTLPATA